MYNSDFPPLTPGGNDFLRDFFARFFDRDDLVCIVEIPETGITATKHPATKFFGAQSIADKIRIEIFPQIAARGNFLCFGINPYREPTRRNEKNVSAINAICLDLDERSLPQFDRDFAPHFVFKRDDSHYHVYFLLERLPPTEQNIKKYRAVCDFLIKKYGSDKSVKDLPRIIRLPFFPHTKNGVNGGHYKPVFANDNPRYDIDSLASAYGYIIQNDDFEINQPDSPHGENKKRKKSDPENLNIETLLSHVMRSISGGEKIGNGERNSKIYIFGCYMHDYGVEIEDAKNYAENFNGKYFSPALGVDEIHAAIESAYRYAKNEFGSRLREYNDLDTNSKRKKYLKQIQIHENVRKKLENYVYVRSSEKLINVKTCIEKSTVNSIALFLAELTGERISLQEIVRSGLIKIVERSIFDPAEEPGIIFDQEIDDEVLNVYTKPTLATDLKTKTAGEVREIIEDYFDYMTNTEEEKKILKQYLSQTLLCPGTKLPWAMMIVSRHHGIGKSILYYLYKSFHGQYCNLLQYEEIESNFTHFMKQKTFLLMDEVAQGDKISISDKIKNLITAPVISINEKYAKTYMQKNAANFMFFSNRPDALKLDPEDRRFFVIYHDKPPRDKKFYDDIVDVFKNHASILHEYFEMVDMTDFHVHSRPPMSAGKMQMIEQSKTDLELYLDRFFEDENNETEIIDVYRIIAHIQTKEFDAPNSVKNRHAIIRPINNYLLRHGFYQHKLDYRYTLKNGEKFRVKATIFSSLKNRDDAEDAYRRMRLHPPAEHRKNKSPAAEQTTHHDDAPTDTDYGSLRF